MVDVFLLASMLTEHFCTIHLVNIDNVGSKTIAPGQLFGATTMRCRCLFTCNDALRRGMWLVENGGLELRHPTNPSL